MKNFRRCTDDEEPTKKSPTQKRFLQKSSGPLPHLSIGLGRLGFVTKHALEGNELIYNLIHRTTLKGRGNAMFLAAIHGFVLAAALILPIGMQNGFIISQGAVHRRLAGALPAVITAGICDSVLIALAVLGVSAVALHMLVLRITLGVTGVIFLLYMGWTTWHESAEVDQPAGAKGAVLWPPRRQITFAVSVSLLNPHALIDTLAVIGGSALVYTSWGTKIAFGISCAGVSWLWFVILLFFGRFMGRAALKWFSFGLINRISALMMWGSSIYLGYVLYSLK